MKHVDLEKFARFVLPFGLYHECNLLIMQYSMG